MDVQIFCDCVCKNIQEGVVIEGYLVDCQIVLCLFNEVFVIELVCFLCYKCYYFMVIGFKVSIVVVEFFEYVNQEMQYVDQLVECIM